MQRLTHNCEAFFLSDTWLSNEALHLYTDASGAFGYAAVLGSQWFNGPWHENWLLENITIKEFYPIVASVEVWASYFANKKIVLHTDNQALVYVINATTSKDKRLMILVRKFVLQCMCYNILFKAEHLPGSSNVLADHLSRQQVAAFKKLAPWAEPSPVVVPENILPCNWCLNS